ncbi:MAG: HAD family phosphatase, partial [Hyphomonadaceae bacterium]|nr:HAD family phosphatase [Hyphomonadaceae bacterium]
FSADDVAQGKPAPDVYLLAANTMGFAPEQCCAIEDSPNGARAGVAAGMTTFGYSAQIQAELLEQAGVDAIFADMRALPGLVKARFAFS